MLMSAPLIEGHATQRLKGRTACRGPHRWRVTQRVDGAAGRPARGMPLDGNEVYSIKFRECIP